VRVSDIVIIHIYTTEPSSAFPSETNVCVFITAVPITAVILLYQRLIVTVQFQRSPDPVEPLAVITHSDPGDSARPHGLPDAHVTVKTPTTKYKVHKCRLHKTKKHTHGPFVLNVLPESYLALSKAELRHPRSKERKNSHDSL
jgi:hypothetical protein